MNTSRLRADFYLLTAAVIWGFAFVSQRIGMEHMGPYSFNAVRFLFASLSLIPVIWLFRNSKTEQEHKDDSKKSLVIAGIICGLFLFTGASLQQIGIQYTTAGKAAFITGLYMVFVPILGMLFLKEKTPVLTWFGAAVALCGLYLLSIQDDMTINRGDIYELVGSLFWAGHVLSVYKLGKKFSPLKLSLIQITVCSLLSFGIAFSTEVIRLVDIMATLGPLLYAGIASVGIAYTLQIIGQRSAPPAHAAVLLSLEIVFAAIGGWMFLNEVLTEKEFMGCMLMMTGMLLSQSELFRRKRITTIPKTLSSSA